MVSQKGSLHIPNFDLERILHKRSSDQIVVLPFKRGMQPQMLHNLIIQIILVILQIVTDRTNRPTFNFKNKRLVSLRVKSVAIDLGTQTDLIVHLHESMVILDLFTGGRVLH